MKEDANQFGEIKFFVETVDLPIYWYMKFVDDARTVIEEFETLELFPDVYKRRFESIGVYTNYDPLEFESDTFEIMGISVIKITLPDDERITDRRVPRLYLTYTETEDGSLDCAQVYFIQRIPEGPDHVFFVDYTGKSRFECLVEDEQAEERAIVKYYFQHAKDLREVELMSRDLLKYLKSMR